MKLLNCITALSICAGCAAAPSSATATTPTIEPTIEPAFEDEPVGNAAATGDDDRLASGRLRVSGEGKLELQPDMARITLSVESRSRNADKAVNANAASIQSLLTTLSAAGVADADVKTAGYEVFPSWERRGQTDVHTTIEVTVRDLSALGTILKKSLDAGATTAQGIQFDVADRDAREKAAMKLAVTDARERGEALAAAAGRSLGEVMSIDTVINNPGGVWYGEGSIESAKSVPIAPGTLAINVEVTVAFALEA